MFLLLFYFQISVIILFVVNLSFLVDIIYINFESQYEDDIYLLEIKYKG